LRFYETGVLLSIKEAAMKKLWVIVGLVLLFFSCGTTKTGIVFDEFVPVEQTAQIWIYNTGTITSYNGTVVDWKPKATETIQIPAGDTLFLWDIKTYSGISNNYVGKDMSFRYNFQPRKKYLLIFDRQYDSVEKREIVGIKVHTYKIGEKYKVLPKDVDAHFTAFVPLINNSQGGPKTVLE
jgi:hypothetical protein